jgi:hypothetical protein
MTANNPSPTALMLQAHLSADRLSTYVQARHGDLDAAIELYRWNSTIAAAFWESLGHVEVVLRNALRERLAARHARLGRAATWLDDPAGELDRRAIEDIATARRRVRTKGKRVTEGQVVAELSFGFWRFLIAKRYMKLWPDLASAFPLAPDRRLTTVEAPVARLYSFRNRLAHHERVWSEPLTHLDDDMTALLGFIDPNVRDWVAGTSRVQATLALRP